MPRKGADRAEKFFNEDLKGGRKSRTKFQIIQLSIFVLLLKLNLAFSVTIKPCRGEKGEVSKCRSPYQRYCHATYHEPGRGTQT
jgi:hypothetical protein